MRRPALLLLALATAASFLGWRTYKAWTSAEAPAEPVAGGFAPLTSCDNSADNALRNGDLAVQTSVIVSKPLFRPDRKPYHENAATVRRNYDSELSRFQLIGVLMQGGTKKGMVSRDTGGRKERWEVETGDSLPGFTVKEVQTDGLMLSSDRKDFFLPLYAGGPKGQTAGSYRTEAALGTSGVQPAGQANAVPPKPNRKIGAPSPPVPPAGMFR